VTTVLRPQLRAKATARAKLKARRPPQALVEVLAEPEDKFRRDVARLEQDELFQRLERLGVVKRRRLVGRLPPSHFQAYMDAELLRFLDAYGISNHPRWHQDFMSATDHRGIETLARRFDAPLGEVRRFARYLQQVGAEPRAPNASAAADIGRPRDPADYVPARGGAEVEDAIAVAQVFVRRYGVGELEFVRDFLWGEEEPETLAQRYGADVAEIHALIAGLESVHIASAMEAPGGAQLPTQLSVGYLDETPEAVVAHVDEADDGCPSLRFEAAAEYAVRYRIMPDALSEGHPLRNDPKVDRLLTQLRSINHRRSVVSRIVTYIFQHQREYFSSRDPMALRPLAQADIARALGEHPSTISRALRGKALRTPEGIFELQYFCQGNGEVIRRLASHFPAATAEEVRRMMAERYGRRLSRRTVAYHLHKARK
jgi:hypothetical protein